MSKTNRPPSSTRLDQQTATAQRQDGPQPAESTIGTLRAEAKLVLTHLPLIAAHADVIKANPEWYAVRSPIIAFSMIYRATANLSLGQLCEHWEKGTLMHHDDSGSPIWIYAGGGSPMSGAGRCRGVDALGVFHCLQGNPLHFGLDTIRFSSGPSGIIERTLADFLVTLGVDVPCTRFFLADKDGQPEQSPSATYNPHDRTLNIDGTDIDLDSLPDDIAVKELRLDDATIYSQYQRVRMFVDGPVPPLRTLPLLEKRVFGSDL